MQRRRFLVIIGGAAGAISLGAYSLRCLFSTPPYRGLVSDHFDGTVFGTQGVPHEHSFGDLLRHILHRDRGPWREWTDAPPGPPPPQRVGTGELRVTFVNHSTVLLQMDGINILTDPIWSDRAGPVSWMGPRRHRPPGIRFVDLPPIDVVLVSHNHYDHLDVTTLMRLVRTFNPRLYVTLGNQEFLASHDISATAELDWCQSSALSDAVSLTCVPAQHFSGRGLCDRNTSLWAGYVIQSPAGNVYFAGDTAYGPHLAEITRRLGPFRLALLPIGPFRPASFMAPSHMSPLQAVQAHREMRVSTSVAIHHGTFAEGDDGETEPVEELQKVLTRAGSPPPRFWVLAFGEGRDVPLLSPVSASPCFGGQAAVAV